MFHKIKNLIYNSDTLHMAVYTTREQPKIFQNCRAYILAVPSIFRNTTEIPKITKKINCPNPT